MLIDSPQGTATSWASGLQGRSPGDAVSIKSSKDKRPKRSPGEDPHQEGRGISARSRVAARTNELDADERRRIIGGEEESFPVWLYEGSCAVPGVWQAEWSRKHPSGAAPVSRRAP